MKYIKHLWKKIVELVIYLLAVIGLATLPQYNDGWIFYLSFIVIVYYSIIIIIKSYQEAFNINENLKEE